MVPLPVALKNALPFLRWWPRVNRRTLRDDLLAGLVGGLIVIPQGIAFATLAGLPPQYGLYSAMVPTVVAALFGSSWHLVSGPTNAISIAVFAALAQFAEPGTAQYLQYALSLTLLVGLIQLSLGLARLGGLVNFISHTVVTGFTAGAGILIAASQISNVTGLDHGGRRSFPALAQQTWAQLGEINLWVVSVALFTLMASIVSRRFLPRAPYLLVAMVAGSLYAALLAHLIGPEAARIATVGTLPAGLPPASLPDFSPSVLLALPGSALVVAILAITQAVSVARAIGNRSGQQIDVNQEFIGQGLANVTGAFFSAFVSPGSFNRSGLNYEAGAKTPLAAVFSALALVVLLTVIAPLAAFLPYAVMAGVLFLVAWGLIDIPGIRQIWRASRLEFAIFCVTFLGTLIHMEAGLLLGVLLSLLAFIVHRSRPEIIPVLPVREGESVHFVRAEGRDECPQLQILRVNGSAWFGAAHFLQQALRAVDAGQPERKSVLIAAQSLNTIDVAGAEILCQEARRRRELGGRLYFYGLNRANYEFLKTGGYLAEIGEDACFRLRDDITQAIPPKLDAAVCGRCSSRVFKGCGG